MNKVVKKITVTVLVALQLLSFSKTNAFSQSTDSLYDKPNSGTTATFMGRKLYTGQVHSHTSLSDGQKLPKDAWKKVKENTTLDFFAIADHDVCLDYRNGDEYITDISSSLSDDWRYMHESADEYNQDGKFVTVAGEEITWYDQAGHMNLFNTAWKYTAYAKNRFDWVGSGNVLNDLPSFYARLAEDPNALAQFNHPSANGKGDFFNFTHYNKETDKNLNQFEYKITSYLPTFQNCLDAGWHVSPNWSGDEHSATWGESDCHTGIWADTKTREGLFKAFRERTTYSTFDKNFELTFSANDKIMGSILPNTTAKLHLSATLFDPDSDDKLSDVTIYSNNRKVVKKYDNVNSNKLIINETIDCADGDYYFIVANQNDGEQIVSAPVWIGETTRGTNFAPEITINGEISKTVSLNQTVSIPSATAIDDTDGVRNVSVDVVNLDGEVKVNNNSFVANSYGDYIIRYRAEDSKGSTRVKLVRVTVDTTNIEADTIFDQFAPSVSVGQTADKVGINVVTDVALKTAYLQYANASDKGWDNAVIVASKKSTMQLEKKSEINAPNYENPITDKPLLSHEFDLTSLKPNTKYKYRLGVSENGGFTTKEYSFKTANPNGKTSMYILGDLQVHGTDKNDYQVFNNMLSTLKEKSPEGSVMVQLGDFVDNAAKYEYWKCLSDYVLKDLNMLTSTVTGNHETYNDLNKAHSHTDSKFTQNSTFTKMWNLPKNGSEVGESNYSYDVGEVHVAVLDSITGLDEQLEWLKKDMRKTEKPWRVVMGHYSYFGGNHSSDAGIAEKREKVSTVLQQLGVCLYIAGHDHVYKRTTIRNGVTTNDEKDLNQGTTFVTSGSAGPKFYDNKEFWWDNVVFDDDVQTGMVLNADSDSLALTTYTIDGKIVDTFTLSHAKGIFELASSDIQDRNWNGVGFLSTSECRENITIVAAKYNEDESKLLDVRTQNVKLERKGKEQYIAFETPIMFDSTNVLKVMVWDGMNTSQPLLESKTIRKGKKGQGTIDSPFEIYSWEDFEAMSFDPSSYYKLMNDIDLENVEHRQLTSDGIDFTGVLDGNGHTITGYKAGINQGAGLFSSNDGTIKNLSITNVQAESKLGNVGILCDVNRGTIENCYTSGSIQGKSVVGGLVGCSYGTIRNCYSTADVHSLETEAGGIVGIAYGKSITDSCYSTGLIKTDNRNAGGIVGYGYTGTVVRNCIALNSKVDGNTYSNRVIGRVFSGHVAILENNYGSVKTVVIAGVQGLANATTEKGATATLSDIHNEDFYKNTLMWDFESNWQWDSDGQRPVLQSATEDAKGDISTEKPSLPKDDKGYYLIKSAKDLLVISQFPEENYKLDNDITLTGSMSSLCADDQFLGEFDGNGHKIIGYKSSIGGLIHSNSGIIKNVAMEDANIIAPSSSNVGILCNNNNGIIEQCYTTGLISGSATTGGVVGYLYGTIKDCYSTAKVSSSKRQAGGVVGISGRGSLTINCYATGEVYASSNAGGITGYTYKGTTVKHNFALNPSVSVYVTGEYSHRVAARTYSSETATIDTNFAWNDMSVSAPALKDVRYQSLMGAGKTLEECQSIVSYRDGLSWDFDTVWQWDDVGKRPVLRACKEEIVIKPALIKDSNGYYQISSEKDLQQISLFPDEKYILKADIDLSGKTIEQLCQSSSFKGTFDGNGYEIKNFTSTTGGLFKSIIGTVKNLGVVNANVSADYDTSGILCDISSGTIEQCYTTGVITGSSTVGGIVGLLKATLKNSYSTADVTVSKGRYAGGLVGISARYFKTVIEKCYSTGNVKVLNNESAAGITGYTYKDSTVKDCFALNASISATNYAHRIVARTLGTKEVATLQNNFALKDMVVGVSASTEKRTSGWMGIDKTLQESQKQSTFEKDLSWDFANVWEWDDVSKRPVLKNVR